jgi:hypothetical protein
MTPEDLRQRAAELRRLARKDPHSRAAEAAQEDHRTAQRLEAQARKTGK